MTSADEMNGAPAIAGATDPADVWFVRVVWTTNRGETYTEGSIHHFHGEPRTGDLHMIAEDAIERRDLARGRHSLLLFNTEAGFPVGINPDAIADLTVEVTGPQDQAVTTVEGGYLDDVA